MVYGKTIQPMQIIDASDIQYSGKMTSEQIIESINSRTHHHNTSDPIVLANGDTVMNSLANCCTPIPGDEIVGFVSTGQGVKVHRKDCPNVNREGVQDRLIEVKWNPDVIKKSEYPVDLAIECHDRERLLIDIVNALSGMEAKVTMIQAKLHPSNKTTTVSATILAKDLEQLGQFMHAVNNVKGVYQIRRITH
jgi:GTP pyrophosphokinase